MVGTNSYVTKLKAQLDQAIVQREHWKQLAENRNSIVVTEVCPESRSVEEYIIDADSVRSAWRLIRGYREQIEALQAENGRLKREAGEAMAALVNQRDAARTELEAARGLLLEAKRLRNAVNIYPGRTACAWADSRMDERIDAFLTATPATEVRHALSAENQRVVPPEPIIAPQHPLAAMAEQGERQEAVAWRVSISGMWQYFNTQAEAQAEYDQCHAGDEDYAEYSPEPLYTLTPPAQEVRSQHAERPPLSGNISDQDWINAGCPREVSPPAQDVSGLVELLREVVAELEDWRMSFPDANSLCTDNLLLRIDAKLATLRHV